MNFPLKNYTSLKNTSSLILQKNENDFTITLKKYDEFTGDEISSKSEDISAAEIAKIKLMNAKRIQALQTEQVELIKLETDLLAL